jgi:hypothetical protein
MNDIDSKFLQLYSWVTNFAMKNNQVIGENRDYYITLQQLEEILKQLSEIYD